MRHDLIARLALALRIIRDKHRVRIVDLPIADVERADALLLEYAALSAQGETAPAQPEIHLSEFNNRWNKLALEQSRRAREGETAPAPVDEQWPDYDSAMRIVASAVESQRMWQSARTLADDLRRALRAIEPTAASPLPPGEGLDQLAREIHREISYDEAAACERAEDDKEPCITCGSILAALTRARAQGQPEPQP